MASEFMTTPQIRIGTCGYSYPGPPPKGWRGVFYPPAKGKRFDELEFYAQFFCTVEINTTFYRPPVPEICKAWVSKTHHGFEFAVKAWQKFTHANKIGEDAGKIHERWKAATPADVELFKAGIEPLFKSGRLGVLPFQMIGICF